MESSNSISDEAKYNQWSERLKYLYSQNRSLRVAALSQWGIFFLASLTILSNEYNSKHIAIYTITISTIAVGVFHRMYIDHVKQALSMISYCQRIFGEDFPWGAKIDESGSLTRKGTYPNIAKHMPFWALYLIGIVTVIIILLSCTPTP